MNIQDLQVPFLFRAYVCICITIRANMVQSFCSFRSRSQKRTGVFSGNKKLHFVEQTVVFCEGGLTTNRFGQASLCRLFLVSIASSSKKTHVSCCNPRVGWWNPHKLPALWLQDVTSICIICSVPSLTRDAEIANVFMKGLKVLPLQAYGSEMPMDHQAWTPLAGW